MDGCDTWEGPTNGRGYGLVFFKVDGKQRNIGAHRLIWMQNHGHLESRQVVMHLCDNPACINIDHLAVGSQGDNLRDMAAKGRHHNQRKTECPKGHPYDETNTRINHRGKRECRICAAAKSRADYEAWKAKRSDEERRAYQRAQAKRAYRRKRYGFSLATWDDED